MKKQILEQWLGIAAFVISLLAVGFTGGQWYEARQARFDARRAADSARADAGAAAKQAREDAERAAKQAREDAERAAKQAREDAQRNAELQVENARLAAAYASRSAKAAEESALIARQALQIGERPYLSAVVSLPKLPSPGEKISAKVVIHNSGKTPALSVTAQLYITYGNTTEAQAVMYPVFKLVPLSSRAIVAAGDTLTQTVESSETYGDREELMKTKKGLWLYVLGKIDYEDMFHSHHETKYCYWSQLQSTELTLCNIHNSAD